MPSNPFDQYMPNLPPELLEALNDSTTADPSVISSFTFQPGGTGTGPVIFNDWFDFIDALDANRLLAGGDGLYHSILTFDDSFVSPCIVPANGVRPAYNMWGCDWQGHPDGNSSVVHLADGSSLVGFRRILRYLSLHNLNTTTPADESITGTGASSITIGFSSYVNTTSGGAPLWEIADTSTLVIELDQSGAVNSNTSPTGGPVVNMALTGAFTLLVARDGSLIPNSGIEGVSGTFYRSQADSSAYYPNSYAAGFLGTQLEDRPKQSTFLQPFPLKAAPSTGTQTVTLFGSKWFRYDVSGGAIAQSLPQIDTDDYRGIGLILGFSEDTGADGLTIVPNGSNTINGVNAPYTIPGGRGVLLICDGITNWRVISVDAPVSTNVAITLGVAAATFAKTSGCMSITGDGGGNTVTTITGGVSGQELDLIFRDALVTITDDETGTADTITLSAAFTGSDRDILTLKYDGTSWYEKSRSVN